MYSKSSLKTMVLSVMNVLKMPKPYHNPEGDSNRDADPQSLLPQSEENHQSVTEYRLTLEVLNLTGSDVLFMHWHVQMLLVSYLLLQIRKF